MKHYKSTQFRPSKTVVSHVKWTPNGTPPMETIHSGQLAGFEDYFRDSPDHLSSLIIGLVGNNRLEVISWLQLQAEKIGMTQYVTDITIELIHSYVERINGVDANGMASCEYDLTKPTIQLKNKILKAWSSVVINSYEFDAQSKIDLLTAASFGKINQFLPISSVLLSKAFENMHDEFQHARAIIFPGIPIACTEWKKNPARLIAFREDAIVK